MEKTISSSAIMEPVDKGHSHLICWKSTMAGFLISLVAFLGLTALGAGVLGSAAQNAIEQERNGSLLATGAGIWLGLAVVIALFLGSYFTVRLAKSVTNKVGAAHGFIVASLFFLVLSFQIGSTMGHLSHGLGRIAEGIGQASANATANPMVQDSINQALAGANLKSDASEVARGLAFRLMQGNVVSAKSYLSYQTGLSGADLDARIERLKASFDGAVKEAGETAAKALADAGYSLAVVIFVGLFSALVGGRVAAHANVSRPLALQERIEPDRTTSSTVLANQRGSALPYIFGWLLGVPMSVLFLIFLLRSVF